MLLTDPFLHPGRCRCRWSVAVPALAEGPPGFESRRNEPEQAKDYRVKDIHNLSLTAPIGRLSRSDRTALRP
jgi:hypothetical protein